MSRSNREGEDPGLDRERGESVRPPIVLPESPPLGERRPERAWDPDTLLCVFHPVRQLVVKNVMLISTIKALFLLDYPYS